MNEKINIPEQLPYPYQLENGSWYKNARLVTKKQLEMLNQLLQENTEGSL